MNEKTKVIKLTDQVSPFVLKIITESSDKYRKAYKSYAFGLVSKLGGKWLWIILGVVAMIVVLLFISGNIPMGG